LNRKLELRIGALEALLSSKVPATGAGMRPIGGNSATGDHVR
jgi:hypothetical protein